MRERVGLKSHTLFGSSQTLMQTEDDYKFALAQVDALSDADEGTDEFDRLDVLVTLIEAYEAKHYRIGPPSFEAAVDYEMEKRGISRGSI